ncbi:PHD finger protein 20-like protein 1 [Gigantopelta aegis]|uniref:PHD finger protein 20-like protein 1 n=1 Tax=Gigantopelta aegis TaxID=1735272 RepID=UPI001B88DCA3|nr:PHD finger protein 20-like protein 1 [Gigantopelta aegis]
METDSNVSSDMAQSCDMDASFASYVSDSSTVNTSTGSSANTSTSRQRCLQRPGIQWKKGEKIEAMDSFRKWYAAKFADIDFEDKLVLIHFEGWNQRYDEWIPFNSERLRPMTRHSGRKEGSRKQKREHRPGERVLAKWTDCKMYPAKVTDVRSDGSLEVVFYDGFKRSVQPINVRSIPQEYKQIVKSEFKKLERKLTPGGRTEGERKHHKPEIRSRSSSRDGKEETVPLASPKSKMRDVKRRPTSLKMLKRRKLAMTKTLASHRSSGRKRVLNEMKKAEQRRKVQQKVFPKKRRRISRKSLSAASKEADTGKAVIQSSIKHILNRKGISRTKKRAISLPTASAKSSCPSPVVTPGSAGSSKCHAEGVAFAPSAVASKAFKIEEDHNLFKCTHEGCTKSFRKEKLLESHIKYYHLDDSKAIHGTAPRAKRRKTISICSTDSEQSMLSGGKGTSTPNDPSPSVSPAKRRHISADGLPFSTESPVHFASPKETQTPHEISPLTFPQIKEELPDTFPGSVVPASVTHDKKSRSSSDATVTVSRDQKVSAVKEEHAKHSRSSVDSNVTEGSVAETEDEEDGNEVVNCVCGFYETDGLMIQCDICLCWQHAQCLNLDKDSVPTNYICFICENPPGFREGCRSVHNQEWLKSGHLPPFSFLNLPQSEESRETSQAIHSLVGDLHNINAVLHGLQQQIKVSQDSENAELSLWYKDWDDLNVDTSADTTEEFHSVSVEESPASTTPVDLHDPTGSKDTPPPVRFSLDIEQSSDLSMEQPKFQLPMTTESLAQSLDNIDTASEASTMTASESSTSFMSSYPSNPNMLPDATAESRVADFVVPSSDSGASNKNDKSDVESSTVTRRPVDKESMLKICQRNLLLHVIKVQNEVNQRLDLVEEQVSVLEKADTAESSTEAQDLLHDVPVLKRSLHSLIRDLYKVKRMAAYH